MDAVQDVKARIDVVDLVGEYLPLKAAGTNTWKANCPFHQERTPSFYVSRVRQSWHCFGCDQGGDIISFIEKIEGMEFREALELLAQKAGVVLPKFNVEQTTQKKRLHEVNAFATKFFMASLQNLPQAEIARAYLKKRGVDDLTADVFKVGYAPDSWSALTDALQNKGVTAQELLLAGLALKSEKTQGVYDRFRHRLMFPIADVHGNIVGFTGRILSDEKKEAKYVNTPETPVYRKSAVLYALDKAKGEIRQQNLAVIVEGQMDVIASHQFGIRNVVCSSGTALTQEQLGLLKRFTTNLAIAFDQDAAGNAATLRGLDLARQLDFSIKIISLPPDAGKDPDEAVRKDPNIWKEAIKQSASIMEWIYRRAFKEQRTASSGEDKKEIAKQILPEIKRIADPVERDHWMQRLAKDLGVSVDALREATGRVEDRVARNEGRGIQTDDTRHVIRDNGLEIEKRLLSGLIYRPTLFQKAMEEWMLSAADFLDPELAGLYGKTASWYSSDQTLPVAPDIRAGQPIRPPGDLTPDETKLFDALAFLAEREFQELNIEQVVRDLTHTFLSVRQSRVTRERKRLEEQMREAERLGDQAKIADLLRQFNELT
jgi:DNA primase